MTALLEYLCIYCIIVLLEYFGVLWPLLSKLWYMYNPYKYTAPMLHHHRPLQILFTINNVSNYVPCIAPKAKLNRTKATAVAVLPLSSVTLLLAILIS